MKALSPLALATLGAVGLTLFVALLLHLPYFSELEAETEDQMVALRYHLDHREHLHPPDQHLVLAAIDERTLQDLGAWPLPRLVHGEFLALLAPEKPKAVGWDIFFTDPAPVASDDAALVQGAALFPHMVTASKLGEGTSDALTDEKSLLPTRPFRHVIGSTRYLLASGDAVLPFPALRQESYFGFADEPGTIRRSMPLVLDVNGKIFPSFDLQLLLQYWGADPDQVTVDPGHAITVTLPAGNAVRIPIDQAGFFTLNYRGKLEDFHPISYAVLGKGLSDKLHGASSPERDHLPALKDALVVIGVTFAGTDAAPTPLQAISPLVITHLNVLNNILEQDFLWPVGPLVWMPCYALFLFALGYFMLRLRVVPMLVANAAAVLTLAALGFGLLSLGNRRVPVAMPEVGVVLLGILVPARGFFGEEREKTRIKDAMRAYLSDKVMTKILENPNNLKLGGAKQAITVMFCDIRNFTAYCDGRDPEEAVEVLNEYMELMTQVVFKYDGTIDKYIGDCLMAFWNAPAAQPDHAQRAVCCAMEMRYALAIFKTRRAGLDRELFECGIGIHTGEALVGNMGSSLKRNYTAMGSTVNIAARLEALTKGLNERILISQEVFDQLQGDFPLTDRGEESVLGIARPIHVYAVTADQDIAAALDVGRALKDS